MIRLQLTPKQAQLIELCSRPLLNDEREFLLRIGACIVTKGPRVLDLDEELLWKLREAINPVASVGDYKGTDLIAYLYEYLLQQHPEIPIKEIPYEEEQYGNASGDTNEDSTRHST